MNESIVLGGGCFWCVDAIYRRVKGVTSVVAGYAGGDSENPSYWDIHGSSGGHAEVIKVEFDPNIIALDKILEIFWNVHNPTTPNQQGNDKGAEYRSLILYSDDKQKQVIDNSLKTVAKELWNEPIVTEIKQLNDFYEAEEEHQDFFNKNPEQGYCQIIINPKLEKFEKHFAEILK